MKRQHWKGKMFYSILLFMKNNVVVSHNKVADWIALLTVNRNGTANCLTRDRLSPRVAQRDVAFKRSSSGPSFVAFTVSALRWDFYNIASKQAM